MIARKRLKELAALRPDSHKVISLYVNLDPSEFPTPRDRKTEIDSLLDSLDRQVKANGAEHDQKMELKADLERLRQYFTDEFEASGAHGLAVFAASGVDLFEVHRLERSIGSEAVIDDSPFIEPLTSLPGVNGYCVLLVNRQVARILIGGSERMREIAVIVDDVHRWHDQGGYSQARYQRGIAKEAHDHLKHSANELFALFKRGLVRRLIIGSPQEYRNEVEQALHSYLRERIAGSIDIDVVYSTPQQVAEHAGEVIRDDEQRVEKRWLDRLRSEMGRDSRGVSGLEDTLAALNERRVEALLVSPGYRPSGFASASADHLSTEGGQSPTGESLVECDDVVEPALESALEQSAEIVVMRHRSNELEALGSIGAVLRF